jgi:hypothetical protein
MIPGVIKRGVAKSVSPSSISNLYQSALKPTAGTSESKVQMMVRSAFKNNIPVTEGGLARVRSQIKSTQNVVDRIVDTGSRSGNTIDILDLFRNTDDVKKKFARGSMPETAIKRIDDWVDQKLTQLARDYPNGRIPTSEAHEMKKFLNNELEDVFGELSTSQKQQAKGFTRAIREDIEAFHPELKILNPENGARIELEKAVAARVRGEINRMQAIPMQPSAVGGVATAMVGNWGPQALAFTSGYELKRILDLPGIKSKLALALNAARHAKGPKQVGIVSGLSRVLAPPLVRRSEEQ